MVYEISFRISSERQQLLSTIQHVIVGFMDKFEDSAATSV